MDGFLRSRKTARSQDRERAGMQGAVQSAAQGAEQHGSQEVRAGTPTAVSTSKEETRVSDNAVERTHDMANDLYSLVMSKNNILITVKEKQAKLTAMAKRAVQEHRRLLQRAEQAEQELEAAATQAKELQARAEAAEAMAVAAEAMAAEAEKRAEAAQRARAEAMMATPAIDLATPKARMEKRKRETPGEEEEKRKPQGPEGSPEAEDNLGSGSRGNGEESGEDENHKEGVLIELRAGAKVPTMELRSMVQKSLGQEEGVKTLSHDTAIECRNLDSITTEGELEKALKEQCGVKEISSLRLRKGFDNMKVATVWLHPQEAGKLLAKGSVKLRWSVCPIRVAPRVDPSTRKCYKCLELGHLSVNCKGPDRSKLCYNCGGEGHIAKDCSSTTACMLCAASGDNKHALGGPRCNAYRSRVATKQ
ncbi:uncharacterized protein LOC125955397 [Anopheles darlingi]|uniref:uncharacterized protein LOC125955397 n=1 Tax=Anopheles darlingi TaxID=43151 RepID=UPI0021004014|nr:uncharacterized protein LOC125955397 [Anopheles darlingi]